METAEVRKHVTFAKTRLQEKYPHLKIQRMNANQAEGVEVTLQHGWHRLVHQTRGKWVVLARQQPFTPITSGTFQDCLKSLDSLCKSGIGVSWNRVTARSRIQDHMETKSGKYIRKRVRGRI